MLIIVNKKKLLDIADDVNRFFSLYCFVTGCPLHKHARSRRHRRTMDTDECPLRPCSGWKMSLPRNMYSSILSFLLLGRTTVCPHTSPSYALCRLFFVIEWLEYYSSNSSNRSPKPSPSEELIFADGKRQVERESSVVRYCSAETSPSNPSSSSAMKRLKPASASEDLSDKQSQNYRPRLQLPPSWRSNVYAISALSPFTGFFIHTLCVVAIVKHWC